MSTDTTSTDAAGSTYLRARLALAAGIALLVAGLVLVAVVLPAEYGVDPFGTGARLGLTALADTARQVDALNAQAAAGASAAPIVVAQERPFSSERRDFTIAAGEWVEYKYRLEKGEALLYSWTATGPVEFEFHAEPDGGPRGYAQTYEKGDASGASGTLTAPFSGIHGWYWANKGAAPVTLTLASSGYYALSHEFKANQPVTNKEF